MNKMQGEVVTVMDLVEEQRRLQAELFSTREALKQLMRDVGDCIVGLQANHKLLFDNTVPWALIYKMGESGRKCRQHIGPHNLWDLTNDPEHAAALQRALTSEPLEPGVSED